jgi:protein-L-isoaspartate(D-aspartate) O-methyltransferase
MILAMTDFSREREAMVERQLKRRGITEHHILDAFLKVPREAFIAGKVIGIERQHKLVEVARERLQRLGYDNVEIVEGDGTKGWRDGAPYDAILAAASGSHIPRPLVEQLAPGGRIVMPVGDPGWVQQLVKVTKNDDGALVQQDLGGVRFVPLIGEEGWKDD